MISNLMYDKWCEEAATDRAMAHRDALRMTPGTRVHHRRHTWMVGTVVEKQSEGNHVMVLWEHNGGPLAELPADLRATPVQPLKAG